MGRPIDRALDRFQRFYGARRPVHLLILLACLALTAYVVVRLSGEPALVWIAVWFAAAVVGHDLLMFPVYTAADRSLGRLPPAVRNHVRVPVLASGGLFLLFLPGILRRGAGTFQAATGHDQGPFLLRWLVATAVLFGASALAYGVRAWRARRRPTAAERPARRA